MDHLQLTGRFQIVPANLAEFKRLVGDLLKVTAEDPGALQYDWFFNADETVCVVRERYTSSEALLEHLGLVGEILGPLVELAGGVEAEIFGAPSPQLVEAFAAFGPTYYSFFQGK